MFLGNMLTAAAGATRSSFEIGIAEWNCRMEMQNGIQSFIIIIIHDPEGLGVFPVPYYYYYYYYYYSCS